MSDKISVKFNCEGDWSDHPADPIFHVEEGDVVEVSASLANVVVEAKKGKIVKKKPKKETPPALVEGEACTLEDGIEGTVKDGACVANEDDSPKDGDKCKLENGKDGVIKNGECVKKGILG